MATKAQDNGIPSPGRIAMQRTTKLGTNALLSGFGLIVLLVLLTAGILSALRTRLTA